MTFGVYEDPELSTLGYSGITVKEAEDFFCGRVSVSHGCTNAGYAAGKHALTAIHGPGETVYLSGHVVLDNPVEAYWRKLLLVGGWEKFRDAFARLLHQNRREAAESVREAIRTALGM